MVGSSRVCTLDLDNSRVGSSKVHSMDANTKLGLSKLLTCTLLVPRALHLLRIQRTP